jgi:putative membrane protein
MFFDLNAVGKAVLSSRTFSDSQIVVSPHCNAFRALYVANHGGALAAAIGSQCKTNNSKMIMKYKTLIGAIVAASLATGVSFAKQPDTQTTQPGSPRAQEQQGLDQNSQSSQNAADQNQSSSSSSSAINEPAGASNASFDKEEFIKDAAQGGMMEVNLGQLATQKGQDPAVKELGQRLVTDHSKANDELKQIAQKEGITLSTEADSKHQKMIDHFSGLSGSEFDKAFAAHAVRDHKKDIQKFEKAAQSSDPDVSQFAKDTLPTLREHLQMAEKIAPERSAGTDISEPSGAQKSDSTDKSSDLNQSNDSNNNNSNSSQDSNSATPK